MKEEHKKKLKRKKEIEDFFSTLEPHIMEIENDSELNKELQEIRNYIGNRRNVLIEKILRED